MERSDRYEKSDIRDRQGSLLKTVEGGSIVFVPLLSLTGACVLWIAALQQVQLRNMNDFGLISVFPPATYMALVILTTSFCLALHRRRTPTWILFLHVVVFIILIHGTPNVLYGTLRYSWAWKHVGVVDYIQRHGAVDADMSIMGAYHNWPGFFALNALITEATGLKSALRYAGWAPLFFNLLDVGALLLILSTFTRDRRLVWLSIWFFYLTNWVGQDYFSPQALTYFLYLVALGVCLRWFGAKSTPSEATIKKRLPLDWAASRFHSIVTSASAETVRLAEPSPMARAGLMGIVIVFLLVIASSHQFTPLLTISALALLVAFQILSARGLPILMLVLTVSWIMYMAVAFLNNNLYWVVQSVGTILSNLGSNFINLSEASPGQVVIAWMGRGLSALVWGLAILGAARRLRLGYWDLPAALLVVAPLPLLVVSSYGGEIVFRIYLYSLPFITFFAAALLYPSSRSGRSCWTLASALFLSWVLLAGFLFAYYGKERQYHLTDEEVEAAEYIYNAAPEGSLLLSATANWPRQYKNYELFDYYSVTRLPKARRLELLDDPVAELSELMTGYGKAYFVVTRSQKAEVDMTGVMPAGSLDRIERALMQSPEFSLAYGSDDAKVFVFIGGNVGLW